MCMSTFIRSGYMKISVQCIQGHLEARGWPQPLELFFRCCLHPVFWDGVCHWLRAHQVDKACWRKSPGDMPICASPCWEDSVCHHATDPLYVFWRLSSWPPCCTASVPQMGPDLQPSCLSFKCKLCISQVWICLSSSTWSLACDVTPPLFMTTPPYITLHSLYSSRLLMGT